MSPARTHSRGFTLLELLVVMGILTGFLVMLVQFLDQGVTLVARGEEGQAISDRARSAQVAVERELAALRGPLRERDQGMEPEARLLCQWLPVGLVDNAKAGTPRCQLLRAAVHLPVDRERALQAKAILQQVRQQLPDGTAEVVAQRVQEQLATVPLTGAGNLVLLPWPQGDADLALWELRVLRLLPGQTIEVPPERQQDPMQVPVPGGPELPNQALLLASEVLADGLLWFELRFWSQLTTDWAHADVVFDSARAGWIDAGPGLPAFALDRGAESLLDPTDDVFPRAVQVTMVVGRDARFPPEGVLADGIGPDDQSLRLLNPDRFPGADDGGMVKIGAEWIRYAELRDNELRGLQRGQRGTSSQRHDATATVRCGRTVTFTVPLAFARENWNG